MRERAGYRHVQSDRNARIRELRSGGATYAELAIRFGLTRQRVHQICGDWLSRPKTLALMRVASARYYVAHRKELCASGANYRARVASIWGRWVVGKGWLPRSVHR